MPTYIKDAIVILSTSPSSQEAKRIAEILIKKRLAACVQILPKMTSIYHWKNKVCHDKEHLIIIKSRKSLFQRVVRIIQESHTYEVPQVLALPVLKGSTSYLKWMGKNLIS